MDLLAYVKKLFSFFKKKKTFLYFTYELWNTLILSALCYFLSNYANFKSISWILKIVTYLFYFIKNLGSKLALNTFIIIIIYSIQNQNIFSVYKQHLNSIHFPYQKKSSVLCLPWFKFG